jgi:hypothetical protein
MVTNRKLMREIAAEKVTILFYTLIEKNGKRMLKPLAFDTQISLKMVRAILDNTIISSFYDTLSRNLEDRGVPPGSTIQLRAKFSPNHAMIDPQLTGTIVLCEVKI